MPNHIKEATATAESHGPNDFDSLKRDFVAMQADLKLLVQALTEKGHELADDAIGGMSDGGKRAIGVTEQTIRKRPLLAVLLVFVVGLILGRVFAQRR